MCECLHTYIYTHTYTHTHTRPRTCTMCAVPDGCQHSICRRPGSGCRSLAESARGGAAPFCACTCACRACTHFLQASGKRRGAPPMPPPPPAARRACLCAHIHMRLKARYILIPTGHLARRCQAQGSGLSHVQKDFDQAEAAQARSLPRCLSGGARSSLRALWPSVSPSVCPSNLCTCVQT